jgi:hypothetical protein
MQDNKALIAEVNLKYRLTVQYQSKKLKYQKNWYKVTRGSERVTRRRPYE